MHIDYDEKSEIAAKFEVRFTRYLDADGRVVSRPLPDWASDPEILVPLYRTMVQTRIFDARALRPCVSC